jgi:predicted esterase
MNPHQLNNHSARQIRRVVSYLALLLACAFAGTSARGAEIIELPTRPGVTLRASLQVPQQPRAALLLFAGGNGGVSFAPDGTPASFKGNFLVRSRGLFVDQGLAIVVVGAPSDRGPPEYLTDTFRLSPEHATDVRALAEQVRARLKVPVWLVGTSRGTLSAAGAGLALGHAVDGVVLTASMMSIAELDIDRFDVPVLLVHHTQDTCRATDYRDLHRPRSKLAAPRTELLSFSGGRSTGPVCEAFSYHGFNGIEAEVIEAIARWIN